MTGTVTFWPCSYLRFFAMGQRPFAAVSAADSESPKDWKRP
jgi:hypothetical protein